MPTIYQSLIALSFTVFGFLIGIYAGNLYINRPVIQVVEQKTLTKSELANKSGEDYEKTLLQGIFNLNDEAITVLQSTYTNTTLVHNDLISFAQTIVERRKEEQNFIQAIQKKWFGIEVARELEQINSSSTYSTSSKR
jgi:hypothetical protein